MIDVPTHAADRALERYGIMLTFDDVLDLARRCKRGEGYVLTEHQNGAQRHTLIHGDRVLWVVWMPPSSGKPDGVVVTITPPNHGVVDRATTKDMHHKLKRLGGSGRREKRFRRMG